MRPRLSGFQIAAKAQHHAALVIDDIDTGDQPANQGHYPDHQAKPHHAGTGIARPTAIAAATTATTIAPSAQQGTKPVR